MKYFCKNPDHDHIKKKTAINAEYDTLGPRKPWLLPYQIKNEGII